jgi:hypothetical protein
MPAEEIERGVYLHPEDQPYREGSHPESAWTLALASFKRQARAAAEEGRLLTGIDRRDLRLPPDCLGLTLDSDDVLAAACAREAVVGRTETHAIVGWLYELAIWSLGRFEGRPIQRYNAAHKTPAPPCPALPSTARTARIVAAPPTSVRTLLLSPPHIASGCWR